LIAERSLSEIRKIKEKINDWWTIN
jgi:hypothetical protein